MNVRVELHQGGLEAVAHVTDAAGDPSEATQRILAELTKLGVTPLPDAAEVWKAIENGAPDAGVVVARGTAPQRGIDARVMLLVPVHDTPVSEGADPLLTYCRNVVYPGDVILRKTPASEGIPGKNLLGAVISAPKGSDVPVLASEGVTTSSSELEFRSARYGVALFSKGLLRVIDAIRLSPDLMEARVTVLPDPNCDDETQADKLAAALAARGIKQGIDRDALVAGARAARASGHPEAEVVGARGKPPVDGSEIDYRIVVDMEKKAFKALEGERADFRETESVKNVKKGEVLAEVLPARQPAAGFRLDGSVLQARMTRAQGAKPGDNTALSEDGTKVVSDADGMIVLKGGKFNVVDEYAVPEDVDFSTGNIRASGVVRIRGQVQSGFLVQAGKEVEVGGDVWQAVIDAKGDVRVRGAITSGSKVTGHNVTARFISNSHVEAEGDVEVNLSITSSEVYSRGKLTVMGSQGVIIGGEVNASKGIEAREIGSPSSRTKVVVGKDLRVVRELKEIREARAPIPDELRNLASSLSREFLKDPRAALLALPPTMRKAKIETLQKMKELQLKDQLYAARQTELEEQALEERGAQIIVHGRIHAGTTVIIGPARSVLTDTIQRAVLHFDPETANVTWRRM